jgi:DNA-binding response OmpR family regulator
MSSLSQAPSDAALSSRRSRAREIVLVVEDEPLLRNAYASVLEDEGYVVVSVDSLTSARAAMAQYAPSILVLDLTLGAGFATELLHELAVAPRAPSTVIVSAFPLAPMIAGQFGVEVMRKPFDLGELIERVEIAHRDKRRPRRS